MTADNASYAVCRGIYAGRCSCEEHNRPPCDSITHIERCCESAGIQMVAKAELTRCELNRKFNLIDKHAISRPVRSRSEILKDARL